jgi:predicted DNA-binding transcriptional regulator YafY
LRNQQIIRQWTLLRALAAARNPETYSELLNALQLDQRCSLRTLQRDLLALSQAGFQMWEDRRGKQRVWSIALKDGLPFPIDLDELIALHGAMAAASAQQLPESEQLCSLGGKFFSYLPEKTRSFLHAVENTFLFRGAGVPSGGQLEQLGFSNCIAHAAAQSNTLEIHYDSLSSGISGWRSVDPYGLICTPFGNYLWGYCHRSGVFKTFRLERIRQIRETGKTFHRLDVSIEQAFQNSFQIWQGKPEPVRIHFSGKAAVLASESLWHPSQKMRKTARGVELQFFVHLGKDLQRWILGFGAGAEVLEPASLRAEIAHEHHRAAAIYAGVEVPKKPVRDAVRSKPSRGRTVRAR